MGTTMRVSNLLAQGVGVDVGGCSHPYLYRLGQSSPLCHGSSWCAMHDPKRKKVAFDAVVAVVLRCSL